MALIQTATLPNGTSGSYWKIVEVNSHAIRGSVCEIQLYVSKTLRQANADPLDKTYKFIFAPEEIEAVDVDENLPQGWRDVWYHAHYQLIKALAVSAHGKAEKDRTQNERLALFFYGATDDI